MRAAIPLAKGSASSSRWLNRQSRDPYVRLRSSPTSSSSLPTSYRSRSSFKLVSLAQKHPSLLNPSTTKSVVDLGAAPGGWSQVALNMLKRGKTSGRGRVWAVDILGMEPIPGVEVIKGDFLSSEVRDFLKSKVQQQASAGAGPGTGMDEKMENDTFGGIDTVLSDMMAPMTGVRIRDIGLSLELCAAATIFARDVLNKAKEGEEVRKEGGKKVYPGGNLVMKFFAHPDLDEFKKLELDPWFGKVVVEKPKESRSESSEAYWVCLGFKGDPNVR
ncbi:hypothetical protein CI109_100620 [Kwoniella shandongensis]|uniref:rRNA methyltransferase 2, mitochondrial n=1 Tax=Kwoniella shandongensis TaxID=1734106 RepID=A0A5M6C4R1_9TREE|nr:uncharacterized protein CI109_003458 [Kwoniella shandongensis]KAA5528169.1 hypothetical protein CI109_003458 [Kwoniella shandongensis]